MSLGGHIEVGETIAQALTREVKEQTNLHVTNPSFICLWEFINGTQYQDKRHMLFLNYRLDALSDNVVLNNEGQEYGWFEKNEVLKFPLEEYTKMTLEKYATDIFK